MLDPGALQFWMEPGAHLLHYPICGGELINTLAVINEPGRWTTPACCTSLCPVPGGLAELTSPSPSTSSPKTPVSCT